MEMRPVLDFAPRRPKLSSQLMKGETRMMNESRPSMVRAFVAAAYAHLIRRMRGECPHLESRAAVRAEQLLQANRVNAQFVATMFHDLRTPLSIISGYSDLLLDGAFGRPTLKQAEVLERVSKSARELLEMMQVTLDLTRMNVQKVDLPLQDVKIAEFMKDVESETTGLHADSELVFEWNVEAGLPAVRTDAVKLKTILKNLISNAVRFTDQGRVTVSARSRDGGIELSVNDTGAGIAPEAQAAIFDPFEQGEQATARRHNAAGLGLYIARRLAEMLGGTIAVESQVGQGSTFRVWIPCDLLSEDPVIAARLGNDRNMPSPSTISGLRAHESLILGV